MREYRVGKLNNRFVVSWWQEDGRRRRYRLKAATLAEARREALDRIRKETAPPAGLTIAEIWAAYREDKEGRRVAKAMEYEWKAMGPFFGHYRPEHVTDDLCRAYAEKRRAAKIKDGTIWTELGHLRSAFVWAAKRRMIPFAPPVERPPKPAPKDRYLTRTECGRLIDAATAHHIRLAIILMLSTAARVGAILDLTWDRVDFERGHIRLRRDDSATRKGRATVPMNAGCRAALLTAKQNAMTDHVIEWAGEPVASIKTGFAAAVRAAKLTDVSPHVLRHTAAVHMAEAGLSMAEIGQYLGHDDDRITSKVYARFSPGHMQKAADVLDFTSIRKVQ